MMSHDFVAQAQHNYALAQLIHEYILRSHINQYTPSAKGAIAPL